MWSLKYRVYLKRKQKEEEVEEEEATFYFTVFIVKIDEYRNFLVCFMKRLSISVQF
jgi:hypothetical protein